MILFALLPVLSWVLLFLLFCQENEDWRRSLLSASIVWGCILTLITETLSLFSWITFPGLLAAWLISGTTLVFLYKKRYSKFKQVQGRERRFQSFLWGNTIIPPFVRFSLANIGLIVLPTILLAIVVPPNEGDSMLYHMVRVVNWAQNHNVQHYPTHITHQIDLPPLSSFISLHFQVLSGGDYLANFVQWFSMIGSVIGVSYIAKQLGGNSTAQSTSAVFCATIPLGILQSSTTQNDYVVAFWLMCFASKVLEDLTQPRTLRTTLEIGSSLGLSIFTKPIAYLYGFPFYLMFLGNLFHQQGKKKFLFLTASIIPILLLNGSHWLRNYMVFGRPLGVTGDVTRNKLLTLAGFISIASKNIAINIAIPSQSFNDTVLRILTLLHRAIGIDLSDPRTSMYGEPFKMPSAFPILLHEAVAASPLHLLLILVAVGLYIGRKYLRSRILTSYLIALNLGFFLFSSLIRWHLSGNRYQLPMLVLFSAFFGIVLSANITNKIFSYLLVLTLSLSSFPTTIFSATKPIYQNPNFILAPLNKSSLETSREIQYFNNFSQLKMSYKAAVDIVKSYQCQNIGIYSAKENFLYEYPIWALFKFQEAPQHKVNFQSVGVTNSSAHLKAGEHSSHLPLPCAIISSDLANQHKNKISFENIRYHKVPSPKSVSVYVDRQRLALKPKSTQLISPAFIIYFSEKNTKENETSITYPNSVLYQGEGWSLPEQNGSWTDGSRATLKLPFQAIPNSGIRVSAKIENVFLTEYSPQQTVEVRVNGKLMTTWKFTLGQPLLPNYIFEIPAAVAQQKSSLSLTFHILNPESPQELGLSADPRKLGIVLNRLTFLSQ